MSDPVPSCGNSQVTVTAPEGELSSKEKGEVSNIALVIGFVYIATFFQVCALILK